MGIESDFFLEVAEMTILLFNMAGINICFLENSRKLGAIRAFH